MKKIAKTSILSLSILLASCGNNDDNKPLQQDTAPTSKNNQSDTNTMATDANTTAKAQFVIDVTGDESEPKSMISVVIDGKKTLIKEITGKAESYSEKQFEKYGVPTNALAACGCWWAGQGKYYYLIANEKNIEVYEGWQEEEVSTKEGFHWEKIKSL